MSSYHLVDFHNEKDEPISQDKLSVVLSKAGFKLIGVSTKLIDRASGLFSLKSENPSLATLLFEENTMTCSWTDSIIAGNKIREAVAPLNYITKYQEGYGSVN